MIICLHLLFIYIDRKAKQMPDSVREAVEDVIRKQGALTEQETNAYLADLDKTHRFQSETWSWSHPIMLIWDGGRWCVHFKKASVGVPQSVEEARGPG